MCIRDSLYTDVVRQVDAVHVQHHRHHVVLGHRLKACIVCWRVMFNIDDKGDDIGVCVARGQRVACSGG
eukprot:2090697-Pyramimonas_sp.AAC.1